MTKPKQGQYVAMMMVSVDVEFPGELVRKLLRKELEAKAAALATSRSKYIVVDTTERFTVRESPSIYTWEMRQAVLKAYIARLTKKGYTFTK